jgi:hypothetical protein
VLMRTSEWEMEKNRQNENRVEKSWIIFISTHKKKMEEMMKRKWWWNHNVGFMNINFKGSVSLGLVYGDLTELCKVSD